jgi:hypothetical protein
VNPLAALRRVLGREPLPPGFAGALEADERVLAVAGEVVATSWGLWLPGRDDRLGWHLVSRATWQGGVLVVVEATEEQVPGGAVLLADLAPVRFRLVEPGRLPEVVRARVEASIRSRHHRDLDPGGAWFVQRKVPGRDGIVLQVRPDPGTDADLVRALAVDVARALPPRA